MLQQTQATRVVPYFERFMARFPTPEGLAAAPPADVLTLWSGLGYNRRAIRLQDAARFIVEEGWPSDITGLLRLPGVGEYTAAAVACFAFGEQVPTTDTNQKRVLNRWHGRPLSSNELVEAAQRELPPDRAADWNQAVMDLGAGTCRPANPLCSRCPMAGWCAGPETYVAPPTQAPFRGSSRETRGAVIRMLAAEGKATLCRLSEESRVSPRRLGVAIEALIGEGLVEQTDSGVYQLPRS